MAFEVVEINDLIENGVFTQNTFVERINRFDWSNYKGKQILVRGCGSDVIPPWAFMFVTAKLVGIAKSIRYGNEHDNIVVYRSRD